MSDISLDSILTEVKKGLPEVSRYKFKYTAKNKEIVISIPGYEMEIDIENKNPHDLIKELIIKHQKLIRIYKNKS